MKSVDAYVPRNARVYMDTQALSPWDRQLVCEATMKAARINSGHAGRLAVSAVRALEKRTQARRRWACKLS
jgi:hypothetical protein